MDHAPSQRGQSRKPHALRLECQSLCVYTRENAREAAARQTECTGPLNRDDAALSVGEREQLLDGR
jgi:hypothetical protein